MSFSDEDNRNFGNGEVGGGRNWTPPVHANVKESGKDVTVSLGQMNRKNHTLISGGQEQNADQFYNKDSNNVSDGHAHFDGSGNEVHGSPHYKD